VDESGSEFWFYCIDPTTETILESNHSLINRSLLDMGATKHLIQLLANKLKLDVTEIRPPLASSLSQHPPHNGGGGGGNSDQSILTARFWEGLPAALVVVAVLVFLLALGGIIYLCATWDVNGKGIGRGPKHPSYVVFPSFNPLAAAVIHQQGVDGAVNKEYETQMLQLSVNNNSTTDESINSSDFFAHHHHHHFQQQQQQQHHMMTGSRRTHVFPSSGGGGGGSSDRSMTDDIATLRISSLAGSGNCEFAPHHFFATAAAAAVPNDEDDEDEDEQQHQEIIDDDDRRRPLTTTTNTGIPTANPLYEGYQFINT
jgi:protocadherin-15